MRDEPQDFPLSARLGTLTRVQLQAALDRFDAGTLLDAEAIPFGIFGQNTVLTTDRGEYVEPILTGTVDLAQRLTACMPPGA